LPFKKIKIIEKYLILDGKGFFFRQLIADWVKHAESTLLIIEFVWHFSPRVVNIQHF